MSLTWAFFRSLCLVNLRQGPASGVHSVRTVRFRHAPVYQLAEMPKDREGTIMPAVDLQLATASPWQYTASAGLQAGAKTGSAAAAAPGAENINPEQSERPAKKRKGKAKKGAEGAEATGKRFAQDTA